MTSGGATHGGRWWRRRFLRLALVLSVIWITFGVIFALTGPRDWGGGEADRRGPPPMLGAVVGAAVIATVVAYRRLGRPVSELLEGAERIGSGDYAARVQPSGPRAVRTLGHAFNDMAVRLDGSEEARRRFLADVTHELRTPLTVLRAGVEAQLDGIHPRDDEHLTNLLDQTRTLDRLVDDLRTLALGDAGRLTLHREAISLEVLVADAVAAMAPAAARRDVTLTAVAGGPHDLEVDADPVRLGQVLANLLTNAVRHTPAGGSVTVTSEVDEAAATVTVTDTGPGIAGDPEQVFERFRSATGGSGLGLTIARQLVEAHGGTVTAANLPGAGARFTVSLPRLRR
jgi:two-component system sensor histidine kinase BaeS